MFFIKIFFRKYGKINGKTQDSTGVHHQKPLCVNALMLAASLNHSARATQIFLVRHARPLLGRKRFMNREEAARFIQDYDAADVDQTFTRPVGLPYGHIRKVYCSTLNRSRLTARAIFGPEMPLEEHKAFNEFERQILRVPLLRFPVGLWLLLSRFLWLLGCNNRGIESFRKAQQRSRRCAEHLATQAWQENQVVVVAHGFLNAFIRKELRQLGWKIIRNDGNGYLGVTILEWPLGQKKPEMNIFTKIDEPG
jgi:broad specificity phosphatase PhoE